MRHGIKEGVYHLKFKAFDRKHTQSDIAANVTVNVINVKPEAVTSSGSIRISGITDEDFVRVWNYRVRLLFFFFVFVCDFCFLAFN